MAKRCTIWNVSKNSYQNFFPLFRQFFHKKELNTPFTERSPVLFIQIMFSNFWRFCYHRKAHIFFITHGKFYRWKVFCLEDINENVYSYGHNWAYTVRYRQLQFIQNCFVYPNGLTVSTEIWNLHLWSDDSSNETEN